MGFTQHQKINYVRKEIKSSSDDLVNKYPFLGQRNLMSVLIMIFSVSGIVCSAYLLWMQVIDAWLAVISIALFTSLLHELEHDLIHWIYFKNKLWAHHLMLAIVYVFRPTVVHPWMRRGAHILHHQYSGTEQDIEEKAITNGEKFGFIRLLMIIDLPFSILVHAIREPDWRARLRYMSLVGGALFPLGLISWSLWYFFIVIHAFNFIPGGGQLISDHLLLNLNFLVAVWIAPNVIRMACLHFISSNMHYFGDLERDDITKQTQILDSWLLFPLQAFCFNFGKTHGIHHFVVNEPFYIRQLASKRSLAAMKKIGVRVNDFNTLLRANRWGGA